VIAFQSPAILGSQEYCAIHSGADKGLLFLLLFNVSQRFRILNDEWNVTSVGTTRVKNIIARILQFHGEFIGAWLIN
jgi:hypothetical protein